MVSARAMFQRLVDADGTDPQQWIHLAVACRNQKDEAGEENAIRRALETDPLELVALILRADLLERQGKTHQAAAAYRAVATVSPAMEKLRPELRRCRRQGPRAVGPVQPGFRRLHGPAISSRREGVRRREPQALSRFRRHHGRPQEAFRLAVGHVPLSGPAGDRVLRAGGFSVARPHRSGDRRDPRRVSRRPRERRGIRALHFLPERRAAGPVRGTQQLAALERVPPVEAGRGRRGKRRALPGDDGGAGRRAQAGPAGTHARGDVFAAEAEDPDSRAHTA